MYAVTLLLPGLEETKMTRLISRSLFVCFAWYAFFILLEYFPDDSKIAVQSLDSRSVPEVRPFDFEVERPTERLASLVGRNHEKPQIQNVIDTFDHLMMKNASLNGAPEPRGAIIWDRVYSFS